MTHWYKGEGADLVDEARTWLGVRWKHQGRTRQGVDCIGLPIVVGRACRGFTFDKLDYARVSQDAEMLRVTGEQMTPVPLDQMRPGDVVVLGYGTQHHMGMIGDYPHEPQLQLLSLIHAHLANRKVEECRLDSVWRSKIRGVFRLEEK